MAAPSPRLLALERAAARGDGAAMIELAQIFLAGRESARDLARSRYFFRCAAEAGHLVGRSVLRAFTANGTGAPADWAAAVRLLDAHRDDPGAAAQLPLIAAMALDAAGSPREPPRGTLLSEEPRVASFPGLISAAEADYLVAAAGSRFQPALIVHPVTRQQIPDPVRTSDLAAFPLALEQPAIHAINRRIAAASGTDVTQGEPLTILRYRPGQQYRPHLDTLPGGTDQRVATMLIYLTDDYAGGETRFPKLGLEVRGRKGDGLLFRNVRPDGRPEPLMLHEGAAVTRGEKLIASRWIRARPLIF